MNKKGFGQMQGFIQGSLWGLIVGGVGLGFVSLVNEPPTFAAGPVAPQMAVPELETVEDSPAAAVAVAPEDTPSFAPAEPLEQVADTAEAAPEVATESAALPDASDVAATIDAPADGAEPAVNSQVDEAPAAPVEVELAEAAPENDVLVVDTAPVEAPEQPEVSVAEAEAPVEEVPMAEETPSEQLPETEAPEIAEETAPVSEPVAAPATPEVIVQEDVPAPQTEAIAEAAPAPIVEDPIVEDPVTEPAPTAPEPALPETGAPATVTEELPQTNTVVRINRPGAAVEEEPAEEASTPTDDALPEDAPALLRYAAAFENPDDLPLISVILVDSGEMQNAAAAFSDLGFFPTITVNALSSDANAAMAAYRAAGLEVAVQADLPDGAQPVDVEVAFEAAFAALPDVAMLFSDGVGALEDRAVMGQVMDILAADGRGFVTVQRGLGNAARVAEQVGVPAATILRDIGEAGDDSRAMVRALDQAAFRARQTGEAVVMGQLTPQTLEALREWAADLDQDTLAIAPVSAILLQQVE